MTLTVPGTAPDNPIALEWEGRATIDGKEVRRAGVPAEDMMQAFIYRHLVPIEQTLVLVTSRARLRAPFKLVDESTAKLPAGGTAAIRLTGPNGPMADQIRLALSNPPEGITFEKMSREREVYTMLLRIDAAKVKPGQKGNLIVEASAERPSDPKNLRPNANRQRIPLGTLPAIPFEIKAQAEKGA